MRIITLKSFFLCAFCCLYALTANAKTHYVIDQFQYKKNGIPNSFPKAKRIAKIKLNNKIKLGKNLKAKDKLIFNLFPDAYYTATIEKISTNVNKTKSMRCDIENFANAHAFIAVTDQRFLITISIPETKQNFIIQSDKDSNYYLMEMDSSLSEKIEHLPALIPLSQQEYTVQSETPVAVMDASTAIINIMVIYSPAARSWADSSGGGIENVIAGAVDKAELALSNSNAQMQVNLIHSQEISYTESGDSGTDLRQLTYTDDNVIDEVHPLRDQYGADLVAMLLDLDDTGGRGWLLSSTNGRPSYGFSLTRVQQASWSYTMIHELGHNMGCHHRKNQDVQPGPGLYSYSAGWRWIGNDSEKYCTVMSYEDDGYSRIPYFSNPDFNYQGVPTGDYLDGDNCRNLRQIKDVIANYRQNEPNFIFPDINYDYIVDIKDYAVLSSNWLKNTGGIHQNGDLSGDSFVNHLDLMQLVSNWMIEEPDPNFFVETLDTDPGWTTEGLWQYGIPQGSGGQDHGNPDPSSGYTGSNVYGYNLSGDYENDLSETSLTTPAIDCTGKTNVHLSFYRWLNVEIDSYDHAYVKISSDGVNWTLLWENDSEIKDNSWNLIDIDISSHADNQPTVYIKWSLETDDSWQYSGWNIDDVYVYEFSE